MINSSSRFNRETGANKAALYPPWLKIDVSMWRVWHVGQLSEKKVFLPQVLLALKVLHSPLLRFHVLGLLYQCANTGNFYGLPASA